MKTILIYILVGIIGFIIGRGTAKTFSKKSGDEMDDMREEAHEALAERTDKRKEKILELIATRQAQAKKVAQQEKLAGCNIERPSAQAEQVTRNDIEKLLDVSSATANRYLNELEDEGKIKQVGDFGKDVYYTLAK
ncbi:hypothetical protein BMS3Abin15_01021 [bacterium BMS3Abin15]|nr:hypothetical protein BMS3Abin15_01021 [bacterium BMS3Abin15]HDZ85147.1 hypothetical protein [Candidatus Moranbacteria bacterium]